MKHFILILISLCIFVFGCKKNSTPTLVVNQLGTDGLTMDQTVSSLLGNWKATDSITTNYYDKNGALITSVTEFNTFPYWVITNVVINGANYCNIEASNLSGSNAPTAWASTISLSTSKGVAQMSVFGGIDTYVINLLNSTTLSVTHTSSSSFFLDYTLKGSSYSAANADQKITFTKY